ncbi:transposase [Clostridiales bacterium F-3ap]|uniref:Transposase n=1 Tax=Anaerotalea alkaliphila TaxID=2662126 RepID=A0A7X5HTN6_9FIRM|nr:transposase [Anaerotalea alkaliphila]
MPVSTGTITGLVSGFAARVTGTVVSIRKRLLAKPVVHYDETGVRTEGTNFWVHSVCDSDHACLSQ